MGTSWNIGGGVEMKSVHRACPMSGGIFGGKPISIAMRIRWPDAPSLSATPQALLHTPDGGIAEALIWWDGSNEQFNVLLPATLGSGNWLIGVPVTPAPGTWYDLVIRHTGNATGGAGECTAFFRATNPSAGLLAAACVVALDVQGQGEPSTNAADWYCFNDSTDTAPAILEARDPCFAEGYMSDADVEKFGRGYATIQLGSVTPRCMPHNAGGTVVDVAPGSAPAALIIDGTQQVLSEATLWDGPIADTTADVGYVQGSHALSYSVGSRECPTVGYSNSTAGNVRLIVDESGSGRGGYNTTTANRPRFKISGRDRRLAFQGTTNGTQPTALTPNNSPGNIGNFNVSHGFCYARLAADSLLDANGQGAVGTLNGVQIGTDANGALAVRIGGVVKTFAPPQYFQTTPTPYIITISGEVGTVARTITLYGPDGVSTLVTDPYASGTGTITRIGPGLGNYGRGWHGVMKGWDVWSRILTAAEAARQLQAYRTRFGIPVRNRGILVYNGSSTPEGDGTNQSTLANVGYQLGRMLRLREVGLGVSGTTLAQYRVTLGGAGTYTEGETVTQDQGGGNIYSGTVIYQNGNDLYVRAGNAIVPNLVNNLVGASSLVSRVPSAVSSSAPTNHLWDSAANGRFDRMRNILLSQRGPRFLFLNADSNAVNLGWTVADVVEITKRFVAAIKAAVPGLRVVLATNIPRQGIYGNSHQAYNTAIKLVTGLWQVVPYDSMEPFDFLTAARVDDDGASDQLSAIFYAEDDGTIDTIHAAEPAQLLMAQRARPRFVISSRKRRMLAQRRRYRMAV